MSYPTKSSPKNNLTFQNNNTRNNTSNNNANNNIASNNNTTNNENIISITGNILSKISFCDKECSNINNNTVKSAITSKLLEKYDIQVVARDYSILNPNNLRIVSYHSHLISPFSNGNPYILYLCKIDGINCCIFIDKKLKDGYTYPKMHCVKYRFNNELFEKETILSGELIKDYERRWMFLIDGILLYRGISTKDKNIISRFELIHKILNDEYTPDKFIEICPLVIKKLFLYRDIKKMVDEFIPYLPYTCKGISFYTLNNKCSNFAFILPRDNHLEIKTPAEIDDIIKEKYPKLWEKQTQYNTFSNSSNAIANYSNPQFISTGNITTGNITTNGIENNFQHQHQNNMQMQNDFQQQQQTQQHNDIIIIEKDNTVFKILKTDMPDIYNLYTYDNKNNLVKYGIALVPNIKISHYLYNGFKENPNNLDMRVECKFSTIFNKWTPVRFVNNDVMHMNIIENIEKQLKIE